MAFQAKLEILAAVHETSRRLATVQQVRRADGEAEDEECALLPGQPMPQEFPLAHQSSSFSLVQEKRLVKQLSAFGLFRTYDVLGESDKREVPEHSLSLNYRLPEQVVDN